MWELPQAPAALGLHGTLNPHAEMEWPWRAFASSAVLLALPLPLDLCWPLASERGVQTGSVSSKAANIKSFESSSISRAWLQQPL